MKTISFLLLLCACLSAQTVNITVTQSVCTNSGDLIAVLQNLPACTAEAFFSFLFNGLIISVQTLLSSTFSLILAVPDMNWFCAPYNAIMAIIESLYTLLIMGLGLFYILRSTDVEGRMAAKRWLQGIFLMVVALTFSFYIFQMLIDINQAIATNLLNQATLDFFNVQASIPDFVFAIVILLFFVFSSVMAFFTLLIRYLLLPFLLLLFPFSLFLYFLPISEGFGKFLLKLTCILIFMTSVDALLILGFFTLFGATDPTLSNPFLRAMASIAALASISLANITIFIIALLMVISQGLKLFGEVISHAVRLAILASFL